MSTNLDGSRLTDPGYCIAQAERLTITATEENWEQVKDDASDLNVLQAALTHLVYLDSEREVFQEKVMQTVFTAYLLGRSAKERKVGSVPEVFRELIESLNLSGITDQWSASESSTCRRDR